MELIVIIALMGYSTLYPHPQPGTYAVSIQGNAVLRADTRTGQLERCRVAGDTIACTPIRPATQSAGAELDK